MVTLKLNEQKELTMGKASVTYRGEAAAEEITVSLPYEIASTPLSECAVTLCLSGENGGDLIDLTRILQENGEGYTATLTLTAQHTGTAGNLDVWVEARKDGFCAKSNRVVFRVKPHDEVGETLPPEQVNLFSQWVVGASGLLSALEARVASTEDAAESARVCYECAESALFSANTACAAAEAAYLAASELKTPEFLEEEIERASDTILSHVDESSFSLAFFSDFHLGDTHRSQVRAQSLPVTHGYRFTDTACALFLKNAEEGTPENTNLKNNPDFVKNYAGSSIVEDGAPWCFEDPGTCSTYLTSAPQNGIIIFSLRDQLGSPTSGDRDVVVKVRIEEDGWYFPYFSYNLYNESAGANVYLSPVGAGLYAQEKYRIFSASNQDRPSVKNVWEKHELWGEKPLHLQGGEYYLILKKTNDTKGSFRYFYLDNFCLHRIPTEQLSFDEPLRAAGHLLTRISETVPPDAVVLGGDYVSGDWSTTKDRTIAAFHAVEKTLHGDVFLIGECDDTPCRGAESAITKREIYARLLHKSAVKGAVFGGFGYGYRDFSAQKMRIIFLNTEEKDESVRKEVRDGENNAYKARSGVGDEQLAFVEEALDVPDGWGIIVCSHRAPYGFTKLKNLLEGYNKSEAKGKLWCCVYGHNHAYTERTVKGNLFYIGCPNVSDGQESPSSDGKTYEKTPKSGASTSGVVITVSPNNGMIYADRIGAGFDRTFTG